MPLSFMNFYINAEHGSEETRLQVVDRYSGEAIKASPQSLNDLKVSVINNVDGGNADANNATQATLLKTIGMEYGESMSELVQRRFFLPPSTADGTEMPPAPPLTCRKMQNIGHFIHLKMEVDATVQLAGTNEAAKFFLTGECTIRERTDRPAMLAHLPDSLAAIDQDKAVAIIQKLISRHAELLKTKAEHPNTPHQYRTELTSIAAALVNAMQEIKGNDALYREFVSGIKKNGELYMKHAVLSGDANIVRALLDIGIVPNIKLDDAGTTPLYLAAGLATECPAIVRLLLDKGANIDVRIEEIVGNFPVTRTPLTEAARREHGEVCLMLLKASSEEALNGNIQLLASHNKIKLLEKCRDDDTLCEAMEINLFVAFSAKDWNMAAPYVKALGMQTLLERPPADRAAFIAQAAKDLDLEMLDACAKKPGLSDDFLIASRNAAKEKQWNVLAPLVHAGGTGQLDVLSGKREECKEFLDCIAQGAQHPVFHDRPKRNPHIYDRNLEPMLLGALDKCAQNPGLKKELGAIMAARIEADDFSLTTLLQVLEPEDWMPKDQYELLGKLYNAPNMFDKMLRGETVQPRENRRALVDEIGAYHLRKLTIELDESKNPVQASKTAGQAHLDTLRAAEPKGVARVAAAIVLSSILNTSLKLGDPEYLLVKDLFTEGGDKKLDRNKTIEYIKRLDEKTGQSGAGAVQILVKKGTDEWHRMPIGTRQLVQCLRGEELA